MRFVRSPCIGSDLVRTTSRKLIEDVAENLDHESHVLHADVLVNCVFGPYASAKGEHVEAVLVIDGRLEAASDSDGAWLQPDVMEHCRRDLN